MIFFSFQKLFEPENKTNMLLGCKRNCRQCFPNGCCGLCKPPVQQQKQVDTVIELQKSVERKDIPYGYVYLYPGYKKSLHSLISLKRCFFLYL